MPTIAFAEAGIENLFYYRLKGVSETRHIPSSSVVLGDVSDTTQRRSGTSSATEMPDVDAKDAIRTPEAYTAIANEGTIWVEGKKE